MITIDNVQTFSMTAGKTMSKDHKVLVVHCDEPYDIKILVSYCHIVAIWIYNRNTKIRTLTLFPNWLYSKTTLKYFKKFINDHITGFYFDTLQDWHSQIRHELGIYLADQQPHEHEIHKAIKEALFHG